MVTPKMREYGTNYVPPINVFQHLRVIMGLRMVFCFCRILEVKGYKQVLCHPVDDVTVVEPLKTVSSRRSKQVTN